jgi:alkylhydroperoxidase family enzyme
MTVTGQKVTDELFAEVRRHFSEAQIVELTAAIALENFRSKFNVALGVESQGFCLLAR